MYYPCVKRIERTAKADHSYVNYSFPFSVSDVSTTRTLVVRVGLLLSGLSDFRDSKKTLP